MAEIKILVTGGSGFLGQHIVKELQEVEADEIRVFDLKPYENKLDFTLKHALTSQVGSILVMQDLQDAFKGVNCVIHAAGVVDFRMFPDVQTLEDVNVKGTANVIAACIAANVPHLIFTCTADVAIGFGDIINGDESLPYPRHHVAKEYAKTKQEAEQLILAANGQLLANGSGQVLRTVSLRPCVMYGNGDPYFVTSILRKAHSSKGKLYRIGFGNALFQFSYVGNVAWSHVCAMKALQSGGSVDGQAYFINDDTPIRNVFDSMTAFLNVRGFRLSYFRIPFWIVYVVFCAILWIFWLLRPIYKFNMNHSPNALVFMNQSVSFKRTRAEKKLNYKPKYTHVEGLKRSLKFYGTVALE